MAKGFNRPSGGAGAGGGMMAQIKRLQEQMEAAQEQLAVETVTSSAGGGAVKVTMTGDQHCTAVEIAPELLQDLVLSAVNLALDESRKLASEKMGPLAGGIPGLGF